VGTSLVKADPHSWSAIAIAFAAERQVFELIRVLWQHQRQGGTVVLGSQPENLKYVLTRFGLEEWMVWLRDRLPAVDVRGVNINSVKRIASDYEEHHVAADDVAAILDFPQRCPESGPVVKEWISQPKLFRERGAHTVTPVVDAIRALAPNACGQWRAGVVTAMLRARLWSYCHDELCNYEIDGDRYIKVAQRLRRELIVSEAALANAARQEGFRDPDEVAFPLLSTGVLFIEGGRMRVVRTRETHPHMVPWSQLDAGSQNQDRFVAAVVLDEWARGLLTRDRLPAAIHEAWCRWVTLNGRAHLHAQPFDVAHPEGSEEHSLQAGRLEPLLHDVARTT
jgi:hypothetical protein